MLSISSRYGAMLYTFKKKYNIKIKSFYYYQRRDKITDILFFAIYLFKIFFQILLFIKNIGNKIPVIYTASGRPAIMGYMLKKILGKRVLWIACWWDTDNFWLFHYYRKEKIKYITLMFIERFFLKIADMIDADPEIAIRLSQKISCNKILGITEGVYYALFNKKIPESIIKSTKKKYNIKNNDFVLLYYGKLLNHYNVNIFPFILYYLKKKYDVNNVKFLIIGEGPAMNKLRKYSELLNVSQNIIIEGLKPFNRMPIFAKVADIGILPFPKEGLQLWEWCAAGLPTIAPVSLNLILNGFKHKYNIYFIQSIHPQYYAKGILHLLNDKALYNYIKNNTVLFVQKKDWKNIYKEFLEKLFIIIYNNYYRRAN